MIIIIIINVNIFNVLMLNKSTIRVQFNYLNIQISMYLEKLQDFTNILFNNLKKIINSKNFYFIF